MDILQLAEENHIISFLVVIAIGGLQGMILGRGIRNKFPSFKRHAKIVSSILLILFSFSAFANVINFANPKKISLSEFVMPATPEELLAMILELLGMNAGLGAIIGTFISITLILLFRFADLNRVARYFLFALGIIVVSVAIVGRLTDFIPTGFQVMAYAFYQFGLTIGIFAVTSRKSTEELEEFE